MFTLLLIVFLTACNSDSSEQVQEENVDSNVESDVGSSGNEVDDFEPITLKFADYMPNTHYASENGQQVWMKKVEELTEGKIKFDFYPGEQLGKATDMLDLVATGAADVSNVPQAYVAGKTPYSSVVSLPGLVENIFQSSYASYELVQSDLVLQEDFLKNGVRPVFAYTSGTYEYWTKEPIRTVDDLKGKKIRSQGGTANLQLESQGAVPVSLAIPEMYEAIDRGTIDGSHVSMTSVPAYKLNEVVNYSTIGSGGAPTFVFFLFNENKWQTIPEELQIKILEATNLVMKEFIEKSFAYDEKIKQSFIDSGDVEFIEVDKESFFNASQQVHEVWIKENSKIKAREVLDLYKTLLEKHK